MKLPSRDEDSAKSVKRVTLQLQKLLAPIYDLSHRTKRVAETDSESPVYTDTLQDIVLIAVRMNHFIRITGDVVYHFEPVFKDEEFDPSRMDCFNLKYMQQECPWSGSDDEDSTDDDIDEEGGDDENGAGEEGKEPGRDPTDIALVRVLCSLGCIAHRQGGAELGRRLLAADEGKPDLSLAPEVRSRRPRNEYRGRIIKEDDGYRSKTLAKVRHTAVCHLCGASLTLEI